MTSKKIAVIMILSVFCLHGCSQIKQNTDSQNTESDKSSVISTSETTVSETASQSTVPYKTESSLISSVPKVSVTELESSNEVSVISSNESSEESYIEEDYEETDQIYTEDFSDMDFLIYKTHDNYYIADEGRALILYMSDKDSLSLENGEFIRINANGTFLSGGVAGYYHEPEIDKVNSTERLTMEQVFEEYDFPELKDIELYYNNIIVRHTSGEHVYLILRNGPPIATTYDIYLDSKLIGSFEHLEQNENLIRFIEELPY